MLKLLQNSVATGREREWAKAHLSAVGSISKTWPNNTCSAGGFRFVHQLHYFPCKQAQPLDGNDVLTFHPTNYRGTITINKANIIEFDDYRTTALIRYLATNAFQQFGIFQ